VNHERKELGMFKPDSPRHCRSTPDQTRPTRAAYVALAIGVTSTLWVGGSVATGGAIAGTMDDVRTRGRLTCGVSEGLPGFSEKDNSGVWRGFDVDFCKAVAGAVLGDTARVEYLPLSADARFGALRDRRIDLLSRNSTWTMSRDLELGVEFAGINYFDGQGFLAPALFGATSPLQLNGAKICVISDTTSKSNATAFFRKSNLEVTFLEFAERSAARTAYAAGKCDVFTGDRSALAAERSLLSRPQDHVILRDVISKEPLGPATRKDDQKWTDLVRWTLFALINAEELGLNSRSVVTSQRQLALELAAPAVRALGLSDDWLIKVIGGVGNYAEIFERNLGQDTPLALSRGMNALWKEGGLLYAPPMQ
jgi:general L-amino acid transport system substrate-binding protein